MKALIFDVFGTLVDWRNSIAFQAERDLSPLGLQTDWHAFADAWRNEYQPAMERVRSGQRQFCKLDVLHRDNLDIVLREYHMLFRYFSRACCPVSSLNSQARQTTVTT